MPGFTPHDDDTAVEEKECRYPFGSRTTAKSKLSLVNYTDNRTRKIIRRGTIWCLIVIFGCILGLGIGIMVWFSVGTDNTGFDPNSPEDALYKNTIFKNCYNTPLSNRTYDCFTIKALFHHTLRDYGSPLNLPRSNTNGTNTGYTSMGSISINNSSSPLYSWCDMMSCFSDFKVIPSTPRSSAFLLTSLGTWNQATITLFSALWQIKNIQTAFYSSSPCKGIEWDDWLFMVWDLASFIWWCIGLGMFLKLPTHYPMPFVLGWLSLWKYCDAVNFHPYDCFLEHSRTRVRIIRWTLYTLATIQFAISIYILVYVIRFGWWHGYFPHSAYDCLASRIPDAPGTSPCSPEKICSNEPIFYPLNHEHQNISNPLIFLTSYFVVFTLLAFSGCLAKALDCCSRRTKASTKTSVFAQTFLLGACACLVCFATHFGASNAQSFKYPQVAPVAFDWECNALHVNLSPWRFYMDVKYQLPVRVAKMWFNA